MLFPYKLSENHNKFQSMLDYVFHEVWMLASNNTSCKSLFSNCSELQTIYDFSLTDGRGIYTPFFTAIENIYNEFIFLSQPLRDTLKKYYDLTKNIEKICSDCSISPLKYSDISKIGCTAKLEDLMKSFYKRCWDMKNYKLFEDFKISAKALQGKFNKENIEVSTCPMCGLHSIKGSSNNWLDHYMNKASYAFVYMNEQNIVPICAECNSNQVKGSKDILYNNNKRCKVFYPYGQFESGIKIKIISIDYLNVHSIKAEFDISSALHKEEVEQWKKVFNICERYKDELSKHYKEYYTTIKIIPSKTFKKIYVKRMAKDPTLRYISGNILKWPYLYYFLDKEYKTFKKLKLL